MALDSLKKMERQKMATAIVVQSGVPAILWGSPGSGKTSFIQHLAQILEIPCETVIASISEPSDFSGLPIASKQGDETIVEQAPLSWVKRLRDGGILFLDEVNTAPPAVQAALLRVVQERVIGSYRLPDSVWCLAASNPSEESSGGWDLTPPLANRFCHIFWDSDPDAWIAGVLSGWTEDAKLPHLTPGWESSIQSTLNYLTAFIHSHRQILINVPRAGNNLDGVGAGKAWPSPRTWMMAARLIAAANSVGAHPEVEADLVAGSVGEGAAIEFLSWRKSLDLPTPEELLADATLLPERDDRLFTAMNNAVSFLLNHKMTKKLWEGFWKIVERSMEMGKGDLAVVAVMNLCKNMPAIDTNQYPIPDSIIGLDKVLTSANIS